MADNDASPDAQTDLKKRARRRLVGAAALALLAVVVLPILMDHEARPTSQDIQIHIPSIDSRAAPPAVTPNAPAIADSRAAAAPQSAPPTVIPSTISAAPSASSTGSAPQAASTPPAATPAATPSQHERENLAAPAKPSEAVNQNSSTATPSEWVVRLGVYQSPANVKRLVAKLKEINVPSYTEKADVPQGPRTRVGAGPFATREAAEKAQSKIRKLGVEGSVAQKQ